MPALLRFGDQLLHHNEDHRARREAQRVGQKSVYERERRRARARAPLIARLWPAPQPTSGQGGQ